jgi:hypothetical protein
VVGEGVRESGVFARRGWPEDGEGGYRAGPPQVPPTPSYAQAEGTYAQVCPQARRSSEIAARKREDGAREYDDHVAE